MWRLLAKKRKARREAIEKAREGFSSFYVVSKSPGWQVYENEIQKEIDNIKNQMANKTDLTGEDLKKLQLALSVYRKVCLIPKKIRDNAKGGTSNAA